MNWSILLAIMNCNVSDYNVSIVIPQNYKCIMITSLENYTVVARACSPRIIKPILSLFFFCWAKL